MANRNRERRQKRRRRRKFKSSFVTGLIIVICFLIVGGYLGYDIYTRQQTSSQFGDVGSKDVEDDDTFTVTEGSASYTVFDVGQGEAILIQRNGTDILIDTGTKENAKDLCDKLKSRVTGGGIEYLVLTSPSEGRVGGLEDIFKNFKVGTCIIGEMGDREKYVWSQTCNAIKVVNGDNLSYDAGEGATLFVIKPGVSSSDSFDRSLITYFTFGDTGFLALSDAGKEEISRSFGSVSACNVVVLPRYGALDVLRSVPDNNYDYAAVSATKTSAPSLETLGEYLRADLFVTGVVGDLEFITDGSDVTLTDQNAKDDIQDEIQDAKKEAEEKAKEEVEEKQKSREEPEANAPAEGGA